jgi:alanine dehydrogenase
MGKSKIGGGILGELNPASWAVHLEMPSKVRREKKVMRVGVPKEPDPSENRVALTPESVGVLVANGHEVFVQKGAGEDSSFPDGAYNAAGAHICYTLADVYTKAETVVKVSPLSADELEMLRPHQTLISAVNLGSMNAEYIRNMLRKNILAIGFEFLQASDGNLPLVQSMSEIAGVTSIHIASELLSKHTGGKGLLLGGITGVPPAVVTIIGAGTVGLGAVRTALGMGAVVRVIDEEVHQLRNLEQCLGQKIHTAISLHNYIEDFVLSSDVVIGAAFKPGYRAPIVVTEDMVANMREGSVIVDVAIDQGGCVETSRLTTHEKPTFIEHDVIHYCVPNIASRVPATASAAVSNILGPLLMRAGDMGGMEQLMKVNEGVKNGVYIYRRHLTKRSMASIFGLEFMDINLLVASTL